jgi:hypothetical protein
VAAVVRIAEHPPLHQLSHGGQHKVPKI